MKNIQFIHYSKCSTCKKALKWLKDHNLNFEDRDIITQNPSSEEIKKWTVASNIPLSKFFNSSGKLYRELNVKEKFKTDDNDELIQLLSTNGMLVKRPIIVANNCILLGFNEQQWKEKLL